MQNGCTDSTRIVAINIYTSCNYVPSGFTPNGDGLTETVKPFIFGIKTFKNFSIYNRWGNLIYYSETNGAGWDGTYKGKLQPVGIYIWVLNITGSDGKTEVLKGTVAIIR
jgi:gliding motility-associated-like protein